MITFVDNLLKSLFIRVLETFIDLILMLISEFVHIYKQWILMWIRYPQIIHQKILWNNVENSLTRLNDGMWITFVLWNVENS